jgi:hypothetical protein
MPILLNFPNLAWLLDKCYFWQLETQTEAFAKVELPSFKRALKEEE